MNAFLPTSAKEVAALGWDRIDVILFSGDAYVDHPSFGAAVIGRLLEAAGYRVAIVPQPNWRDDLRDFTKLGAPRLFFGVTAGAMDSMVNHYTAALRLRSDDAYTPGGKAGFRPDRAVEVYTQILKRLFPHTPVVIGGIEASLRRLTHYDYWSDALRPSILATSGADLLAYGMGEGGTVTAIARALENGFNAKLLRKIPQVAFVADRNYVDALPPEGTIILNSYERCVADGAAFGDNFVRVETESNRLEPGSVIVEPTGERFVVVNPPLPQLATAELDAAFDLPYTRLPHPRYRGKEIPAYEMIRHSINSHRGCFGGCSFCTISAHQGKFVTSRSEESVLREVRAVAAMEGFGGTISDVGGPSANMYRMAGTDIEKCRKCLRPSCAFPKTCPNLSTGHAALLALYARIGAQKGVRRVFVGSGIRYDLCTGDDGRRYLREVIVRHTSGRLKVAPEHTAPEVLRLMRKPPFKLFERLDAEFRRVCRDEGLKYQLVPYFISGHPGCTLRDMDDLARRVKPLGCHIEPVQDFTPTPMTLSSVMYHTRRDPYTHRPVYVATARDEKRAQKERFFK